MGALYPRARCSAATRVSTPPASMARREFWVCAPAETRRAAGRHNDPACVLNSRGVKQAGGNDHDPLHDGRRHRHGGRDPNYVEAADCAAAAAAPPLGSTITCTAVPLTEVPADPATCLAGTTSAGYPLDLISACSGPIQVGSVTIGSASRCRPRPAPAIRRLLAGSPSRWLRHRRPVRPPTRHRVCRGRTGDGRLHRLRPDATGIKYSVNTTTTVTTIHPVNGVVGAPVTLRRR